MYYEFCYLDIDVLEKMLADLDEQLLGGGQSGVAIEARMTHIYVPLSAEKAEQKKARVLKALSLKAIEKNDPVLMAKYPNPDPAGFTRVNFNGRCR